MFTKKLKTIHQSEKYFRFLNKNSKNTECRKIKLVLQNNLNSKVISNCTLIGWRTKKKVYVKGERSCRHVLQVAVREVR